MEIHGSLSRLGALHILGEETFEGRRVIACQLFMENGRIQIATNVPLVSYLLPTVELIP